MSDAESIPPASPKPADGNDPQDPLRPEIEEENNDEETPPLADPTLDMDATEEQQDATENPLDGKDDDSDLSDVDEATFDDFDTAALDIEERPVAIDETNINLIGTHKRKRVEGEEGGEKKKKKKRKDGRKSRRVVDDEVDGLETGTADVRGQRRRKETSGATQKARSRAKSPEDLSNLTQVERETRELEARMDEALRNPTASRRKVTGIDLEQANDELLENTARRMTEAAEADSNDHKAGRPAMAKLSLLSQVLEIVNRRSLQSVIVEPDSRLLEAMRFFLEPLEPDGALPAYNIQREMIGALSRLPLDKDALSSSGIGRVMLFYTKSKKPEVQIKRAAERLIGEWTRPILSRSKNFQKQVAPQMAHDPADRPTSGVAALQQSQAQAARERKLAKPATHRAVVDRSLPSYTVAPQSNVVVQQSGRSSTDSFAKLKARQQLASRR